MDLEFPTRSAGAFVLKVIPLVEGRGRLLIQKGKNRNGYDDAW